MAHARITQTYALELIEARIDQGDDSPSDAEIADYCGLQQPTDSRSLLADLADAGKITIRGTGADRQITLGRTARAPLVPAMPSTALARKANREVDAAVKRIGDIVRRKPKEIAAEVAAEARASSGRRIAAARSGTTIRPFDMPPKAPAAKAPEISVPVVRIIPPSEPSVSPPATPPGDGGEGVQARGSRRDDPAPQPIHVEPTRTREAIRAVAAPDTVATIDRSGKHCMTVSLPTASYRELVARAKMGGKMPGTMARELLLEMLTGGPPAKVHVPAHITAAAQREGVPVIAFVADLLERGFSAWQGEWSLERCA